MKASHKNLLACWLKMHEYYPVLLNQRISGWAKELIFKKLLRDSDGPSGWGPTDLNTLDSFLKAQV